MESALSLCPSMVRTHFDRNRVSNEKRPVGSVSDASMSPRASLTTNVLPSRILTRPLLIASSSHGRRPAWVGGRPDASA